MLRGKIQYARIVSDMTLRDSKDEKSVYISAIETETESTKGTQRKAGGTEAARREAERSEATLVRLDREEAEERTEKCRSGREMDR